jgi:hypothetical protein
VGLACFTRGATCANLDTISKSNRHDTSSKHFAPASTPPIAEGGIVPLARAAISLGHTSVGKGFDKQRASAVSVGVTALVGLFAGISNDEPKDRGRKMTGDKFHKPLGPTHQQAISVWE